MNKPILVIGGIIAVGMLGAGLILMQESQTKRGVISEASSGLKQAYAEITNPSGFLNTGTNEEGVAKTITLRELVGKKIILVDFMTYSCINCQRTFPHITAWYEKYKDKGLEIVGIHTPEFAFEKDINNVRAAMKEVGITYPVVLDNDYGTWRSWGNQYWPRKYLIDINGSVVYDHIGEGAYEETEKKIRELLEERAIVLGESKISIGTELKTLAVPAVRNPAQSPETYLGSLRNEYLGNGIPGQEGERKFTLPEILIKNALYLKGTWNITPEYSEAVSNASIVYKYNAKEVYIVADADTAVDVEIFQDGKLISESAGVDVNTNGVVTIGKSRLYKLIRNPEAGEHHLEIRVKNKKVRFYAFTFG